MLSDCYDEKEMKSLGYDKQKSFNYFLKTEIENVIQDYLIEDEDEYLRFQRIGREKQLGKNQRSTVWDIYQRFLSNIQEQGLDTYKSLLQKFIEVHKNRPVENSLRYDAIFLDEAQDMPPSVVKAISLLKKSRDSLIWLAGDYKQSIYRTSFRWSDVALPFYGSNVKILRKNYRNSKQILDAAHNMLKSFIKDAEKPDHCGREGVDIQYYKYKGKEKFKVVKGIIDYFHLNEGVDLSDIAIFTPARVDSIAKSFDDLEIVYEDVRNPSSSNEDSVKLSTLHSAKGLEFRVVIIIDAQSKLIYPNQESDLQLRQEKAKLLYVGMTRAFNACCFLLNEERENGVILDKVVNPDRVVRVR